MAQHLCCRRRTTDIATNTLKRKRKQLYFVERGRGWVVVFQNSKPLIGDSTCLLSLEYVLRNIKKIIKTISMLGEKSKCMLFLYQNCLKSF